LRIGEGRGSGEYLWLEWGIGYQVGKDRLREDDVIAGGAGGGEAADVLSRLRRREAANGASIGALVLVGVPASFLGPFICACVIWFIAMQWGHYLSWTWTFAGLSITLIPLLFWTEWKEKGSYFTDAVLRAESFERVAPTGSLDVDLLISFARNPAFVAIGWTELFQWGPRLLLEAGNRLMHVRMFHRVDRKVVAEIISVLKRVDHADLEQLPLEGFSMTERYSALAYALWYGWIGISRDNRRIWLNVS
jgi:hypothetical protein